MLLKLSLIQIRNVSQYDWYVLLKKLVNGPEQKVCLVARGFEEDALTSFEKQSPTTCKDTLHYQLQPRKNGNLN